MPVYTLQYDTATGRVVAAQLASGMVGSGTVQSGDIAPGAVVSANIASGQVGFLHIAALGVGSGNLANASVLSANIASGQVGFLHIAALGVGSGNLANASVLSANIASGQVGGNHWNPLAQIAGLIVSGPISAVLVANEGFTQTRGTPTGITRPTGTVDYRDIGSGSARLIYAVLSGQGVVIGAETPTAGDSFAITLRPTLGVLEFQIKNVGSSYIFGASGVYANSGYAAMSSFFASGQIGGLHMAAGAVLSANIASGQIGGAHIQDRATYLRPILNGEVALLADLNTRVFVISGHGRLVAVGNLTTPTVLAWEANILSASFHAVSGPALSWRLDAAAKAAVLQTANPQPAGSGLTFEDAYSFGSGGAIAYSGFWALSSFFGSGQVGFLHIAALGVGSGNLANASVLSSALASGQVGGRHLGLLNPGGVAPLWGAVAFFNAASGSWFTLAPGASGQRLTTNGSGFDPAWAA